MKLCFLIKHSPYASTLARDALDMALASAAFDQQVSLIFIGDGVFQLAAHQQSVAIEQKSIEKSLSALALYDISYCYACKASIKERQLNTLSEKVSIKQIDNEEIQTLLHDADQVISF